MTRFWPRSDSGLRCDGVRSPFCVRSTYCLCFHFPQATFKGWIEIMYDAIDSREVRLALMFAHARLVVPL